MRCDRRRLFWNLAVCLLAGAAVLQGSRAEAAPTVEQALAITPSQEVEYDKPTGAEVRRCTIGQDTGGTAWLVRDANGQTLRRFADTNQDNVVDLWSYFRGGVEVYREIDSNFDNKADQMRWFNAGGTRWGVDRDQNGKIDSWRVISPHEVVEEVVAAIQKKDQAAFKALMLTPAELRKMGAGETLAKQITGSLGKAPGDFQKLVSGKSPLSAGGRFADFGGGRPSTLPASEGGARKDITIYQNVSALLDVGGEAEQVQIGLLVRVGDAWRIVEAPQVGDDAVSLTVAATFAASSQADDSPTEEMQTLMAELERLDQEPPGKTTAQLSATFKQRTKLLLKLAEATPRGAIRDQWFNQLADMYSAAVIDGEVKEAASALERLGVLARRAGAGKDAQAHVRFQRVYTDWVVKSQDPKVDYAKLQEDWRKALRTFAKDYPSSPDTAEALLQLGMVDDLAGRDEEATKWYTRLAQDFDGTPRGAKAKGALRRLGSPGKVITIRGPGLTGGRLDLSQYRGKFVAIQYWATWCEPCKEDMKTLKDLVAKFGGKGFAVLGVNLDSEQPPAQQFARSARLPWKHLYEPGGLESRLANEMGVINLPLMLLVDKDGKVISRNIRADEIGKQLTSRLR